MSVWEAEAVFVWEAIYKAVFVWEAEAVFVWEAKAVCLCGRLVCV